MKTDLTDCCGCCGAAVTWRSRAWWDLPVRLLKERGRLVLKDGILYRHMQDPKTLDQVQQVVLPAAFKQQVWQACHEKAGHSDPEKPWH